MMKQKNNELRNFRRLAVAFLLLVLVQCQDALANRLLADSLDSYGQQNQASLPMEVAPHFLRRIQRSSGDQESTTLADILNIPRQRQTSELQYQLRKQLNNQLSDLLIRAANDKSLEKALLNALIQQQQQQLLDQKPNNARDLIVSNEDQQLASYKPADLANMAAKLAALSDQAYINNVGAGDYATSDDQQSQLPNKRSMLPCNFNAVSCAKNPFRKF